jgi:hypothetical protein
MGVRSTYVISNASEKSSALCIFAMHVLEDFSLAFEMTVHTISTLPY